MLARRGLRRCQCLEKTSLKRWESCILEYFIEPESEVSEKVTAVPSTEGSTVEGQIVKVSEFPLLNSCLYVIVQEPPEEKTEDANAGKFVASSLLFSNAAKASGLFPLTKYYLAIGRLTITDHHHSDDESEKKTLSESAAEYTESHTNKRKYDVVDVVTGDCQNNLLA